jgi:PKD repeat protein
MRTFVKIKKLWYNSFMKKWIVGLGILIIGCEGNPPVAPHLPIFNLPENITLCKGEEFQISPEPVDTENLSYEWLPAEVFSDPTSPFQIIKGEKDGEYYLKVTDKRTGMSLIKKIDVKVNPAPAGNAGDDKVICSGESVEIGTEGKPDYLYFWTPETGLDNPNSPITLARPAETTTYTLTVQDKNTGCSFSDSVTVYVNPSVQAYFVPPPPTCLKDIDGNLNIVEFYDMSTGPVSIYLWDFGDGNVSDLKNPSHTFSHDGYYEVSLSVTSDAGCGSTYKNVAKILPAPTIFSIISPQSRCGPGDVQFGAIVGGGTPPYTYLWDFGNGITSTSPSPVVTFSSPGTYPVRLYLFDTNGCGTKAETSIEILNSPVADFIVGNTCYLDKYVNIIPVELINTSSGNIVSVLWDFGDGSTSTIFNPSHVYENPGDYIITLTVEEASGCIDSITHPVKIYPSPVAISLTSNPQFLCGSGDSQFTLEYTGGTPPFSHYWDFGNGIFVSGASSVVHTYSSTGAYNIRARVVDSNGCLSERSLSFNVYSNPSVSISLNPSSLCLGSETYISGSYSSPYPVTYYSISTGDGNIFPVSSTYYTYSSSGTYSASFVVFDNNGCYSEATSTIWVKPSPVAHFTSNAPVCFGNPVNFTNQSTGGDFYQWDFGDGGGSTEKDPSHFYINPGTYNVSLNAFNSLGCSDSFSMPVTVNPSPIADFELSGNLCLNSTLTTTNTSIGADAYLWSFGNGSTSTAREPQISYNNSGTYLISLTAYVSETGCYDTHEELVDITNPPSVILGNDKTVARGGQTTIGGYVSGGVPPYTYSWKETPAGRNYLSSFTEPYPVVTIPLNASLETITYTLAVTDSKGCHDSLISMDSMAVSITDALSVSAGADRAICNGESVEIGFPAAGGVPPYTYSWSPAEGLSNPSTSPTTASPYSTITYTLTVTDSASPPNTVTDTVTIYVNPNPSSLFISPSNLERCGAGSVDLSAFVTDGTPPYSFLWNYGDGFTEYASSSVSHNYSSSGTYTVLLSVKDTNSCPPEPLTATSSVSIRTPPDAFFISDSPKCFHDGFKNRIPVNFTDLSSSSYAPIVSYLWDFGDPFTSSDTSTERNPSYIYTNPGNYTSSLLIGDFYGCYDIYSSPVTVFSNPIAGFSATTPQCLSLAVQFTDNSSGTGLSYLYDFGDSYTSTESSPSHFYPSEGTYISSLLVRDINMCEDRYSSVISIINPANAGEDGWVYTSGCLTIGSPPQPNFSYQWTSSPYDPSLSGKENEAQPAVCPYTTTTYTLSATSPYGCYGTDSITIKVYIYVTYVYPESGTTVNYTNRKILVSFSEPMSSSTINTTSIKLIQIDPVTEDETQIAGSVQYDDRTKTAIFTPSSALSTGWLYEIRVFSDPVTGVKSIYGNVLKEDFVSSFDISSTATSDTSAPSLVSYSPAGTNVPINASAYAVFNEIVDPLTVNESTFYILQQGSSTPITASVTYDIPSKTIFLTPATTFSPAATYYVYISGIKDLAGNTLTLSPAWSFTTGTLPDTTPPEIISVFPPDGSTADPTTSIYAYFSEAIDPSTLNSTTFKLFDQNGNEVSGRITYDPVNYVATFTPANYLEGWTTYTAYIDGVKDTAGNSMTSPYIWTFTASAPAWEPGDNPSNYEFQETCPIGEGGGRSLPGNELWVEDYTDYYSAPFSWAYYVPVGPDSRNNNCYFGSKTSIDLSNYSNYAKLSFYQKRYFRSGDYGYVEVSLDGTNWDTVATFGGINTSWTKTEIDLSSYIGESIKIRFKLKTNHHIPSKYWKIDEIILTGS